LASGLRTVCPAQKPPGTAVPKTVRVPGISRPECFVQPIRSQKNLLNYDFEQ